MVERTYDPDNTWDWTPGAGQEGDNWVVVKVKDNTSTSVGTDFDYNWDSRAAPDASGTYEDLVASVANNGTRNPDYRKAIDYQNPREVRFGVVWRF